MTSMASLINRTVRLFISDSTSHNLGNKSSSPSPASPTIFLRHDDDNDGLVGSSLRRRITDSDALGSSLRRRITDSDASATMNLDESFQSDEDSLSVLQVEMYCK